MPPHLLAAERALRELAPGGPAAAGLLTDGRWRASLDPDFQEALGGETRAGRLSDDADALSDDDAERLSATLASSSSSRDEKEKADASRGDNDVPSYGSLPDASKKDAAKARKAANAKKYEEYFLRHRLPTRLASSVSRSTRSTDALDSLDSSISEGPFGKPTATKSFDRKAWDSDANAYAAEIAAGSSFDSETGVSETGVVSMDATTFGVVSRTGDDDILTSAETALDAFDKDETRRALVRAQDPSSFPDQSAAEMMAQLRREADAYVNPQTGEALRWGDTWRHEWGGGVGVGRPDRVSRRMMSDGVTMIVPSAFEKSGFALVPTSKDRRALEEFYDECNGPRWSVQKNWLVGEPCANGWHGVVCVGGRVTELWMNLNNVACWGKFNATALAKLDELRYLDLSDNLFSGLIPEELFSMTKLQSLVLSSNRLEGGLSERFGELVNLRHLDVSANGLSGPLPAAMGALAKLEVLYLGESGLEVRNNFNGKIPEAWSGMTSLARLSLSGNNLIKGKFPTWLGKMTSLEELTIAGCSLSGEVPDNIAECLNLSLLDASGNKLRGAIPEGLSRLRKLRVLKLGGNTLEGALPNSLGDLQDTLEHLDLGANKLSGSVPESFKRLKRLEYLDLSRNALEGHFPKALKSLSSLRTVLLHGNAFTGKLPAWTFTDLPLLMHLYVDGNRLSGPIPGDAVKRSALLKELHAADNAFSGAIPDSMFDAPRLASLRLTGNRLSGSIPATLGNCKELARLDLSQNALTGSIPNALANATELAEIRLSGNRLIGPIPNALNELPLLRELYLDDNLLSGSVPDWLASHPCLRVADLSRNRLTGVIPNELYDETLDDGDGGVGAVPRLPARHDRYADEEERSISLRQNPLRCPLPEWADEFEATCVDAEVHGLEPSFGATTGGTVVVVTGANFPTTAPRDEKSKTDDEKTQNGIVGCVFSFGASAADTFTAAVQSDERSVTCVTPPRAPGSATNTAVVRVGVDGEPVTRFGELFRYA